MIQIDEISNLWEALGDVKDPEIPVVSLAEMGILRGVTVEPDSTVIVTIAPTFAGCPALEMMQRDIVERLGHVTDAPVRIVLSYNPPWTTDWINEEGRAKLKEFGIAPPMRHGGNFEVTLMEAVACPYCGSENTSIRNSFGATPCRMIFYCNNCQQPFEQFKPL